MLQSITIEKGRKALAIVLPDYEDAEDIRPLKSALFLAVKNLASNPDFIASNDMVELLNLLEEMDIAPQVK